jgi:hypothetical protein
MRAQAEMPSAEVGHTAGDVTAWAKPAAPIRAVLAGARLARWDRIADVNRCVTEGDRQDSRRPGATVACGMGRSDAQTHRSSRR